MILHEAELEPNAKSFERLESHVEADSYMEACVVAQSQIQALITRHGTLISIIEYSEAVCNVLAAPIRELEARAGLCIVELEIAICAVWSSKIRL